MYGRFKLDPSDTYDLFERRVKGMLSPLEVASVVSMYYFPADELLTGRVHINCDAALATYFNECDNFEARDVLVSFEGSPLTEPIASGSARPMQRRSEKRAVDSSSAGSNATDRNRNRQAAFRDGVLERDHSRCVLCGYQHVSSVGAKTVQAAHVVAHSTPKATCANLLLPDNLSQTFNGVTLCLSCHVNFDQKRWHVTTDGIVLMSAVLHESAECAMSGKLYRELHGKPLLQPPDEHLRWLWPRPEFWDVQTTLFNIAETARVEAAAAAVRGLKRYPCALCGAVLKRPLGPHHTEGRCKQRIKKHGVRQATPIEQKLHNLSVAERVQGLPGGVIPNVRRELLFPHDDDDDDDNVVVDDDDDDYDTDAAVNDDDAE